ncbi:MAG: hypothetical protein EP343_29260 [Deltaproteobacteria bacterium]|nr:MAG: hypothetical protein EP343_29260 [Deltaproteobacteria bacterium]
MSEKRTCVWAWGTVRKDGEPVKGVSVELVRFAEGQNYNSVPAVVIQTPLSTSDSQGRFFVAGQYAGSNTPDELNNGSVLVRVPNVSGFFGYTLGGISWAGGVEHFRQFFPELEDPGDDVTGCCSRSDNQGTGALYVPNPDQTNDWTIDIP